MILLTLYAFFGALLVAVSLMSYLSGRRFLEYFKHDRGDAAEGNLPFATVLVPCRGDEPGLESNLRAIAELDHPGYEVIFIADDLRDPACEIIDMVRKDCNIATQLVIAPPAARSSQKIANLLAGLSHISDSSEVLAFVDSDALVSREWLSRLTAPLRYTDVGATTGYRWFVSQDANVAALVRSAWNASVASALGPDTNSNFCWGGSMAFRRGQFFAMSIPEKWRGALSDDFQATEAVREAGKKIVFVPGAIALTQGVCTFAELLEFTTRQMKITRVYQPKLWLVSLIGAGLYCSTMAASLALLAYPTASAVGRAVAASVIAVVSVLTILKASMRIDAMMLARPDQQTLLSRHRWIHATLCLITPILYLYNCLSSALSRTVTWRGIRYRLKSASETVIIRD